MPPRAKRKVGDFDPNKSDSEDETYGTSVSKRIKARSSKAEQDRPSRKKQRRRYNGDDSDEDVIEDSDMSIGPSEEEEDNDEVEIGPSGRPRREAAKKKSTYEESASEDVIGDVDESEVEDVLPRKQREKPSLVVKLNRNPVVSNPRTNRRGIRVRSGSVTTSRPTSSYLAASTTRRSSRIAHDETEPVVALTNSGHHIDVLRAGTRSPPQETIRPTRAGKGLKKKPTGVVYEESQESAGRTDGYPDIDGLQEGEHPPEIAASRENLGEEGEESEGEMKADTLQAFDMSQAEVTDEIAIIPESGGEDQYAEDDDDDDPVSKPRRIPRQHGIKPATHITEGRRRAGGMSPRHTLRSTLGKRKTRSSQRSGHQESSDFEPFIEDGGEEDVSDSEASLSSPRKNSGQNDEDDSSPARRGAKRRKPNPRSQRVSDEHDSEVAEELAEELDELRGSRPRRAARAEILFEDKPKTRKRKPVDYRILRPDLALPLEDDGEPTTTTPSRRGRNGGGGTWQRSLFSTYGPFGGAGGPPPVFGGPGGIGAAAGADSDSSDDEVAHRPRVGGLGGTVGMTPTTTHPAGFGLFPPPPGQVHGTDSLQGPSGTPANLGKIKDKQALADADPLGVNQDVNFDNVGGLQGHIDQLKEMVALPLLYPEIFQRFHVTPPRGVLFHGPPGTGKTLLARALASSVSSQGRKVTFYMRKGADALSKWVGEAERQLRLLFDEARKNQPSIIFFDEIDGKEKLLIGCLGGLADLVQVLHQSGLASRSRFMPQ